MQYKGRVNLLTVYYLQKLFEGTRTYSNTICETIPKLSMLNLSSSRNYSGSCNIGFNTAFSFITIIHSSVLTDFNNTTIFVLIETQVVINAVPRLCSCLTLNFSKSSTRAHGYVGT